MLFTPLGIRWVSLFASLFTLSRGQTYPHQIWSIWSSFCAWFFRQPDTFTVKLNDPNYFRQSPLINLEPRKTVQKESLSGQSPELNCHEDWSLGRNVILFMAFRDVEWVVVFHLYAIPRSLQEFFEVRCTISYSHIRSPIRSQKPSTRRIVIILNEDSVQDIFSCRKWTRKRSRIRYCRFKDLIYWCDLAMHSRRRRKLFLCELTISSTD